jgi:Thiamine pyrophosphate-requiring enzymes [acetolactate synthase, pyruvate dehydrogenase (cytochrome), glyoxylate carboligase, phosphonopyruvate decarboxylase]
MGYHCEVLERTFAFSRLSLIWTGSGASRCDALDLQLVATLGSKPQTVAVTSGCSNGSLACRVAELSPVRIGPFVPFTIISGGITDRAVKLNSKFVQRCQGHSCDRIFPSRMARTAFTQIVRAGIALNRFCRDKSWYPQPSGRCHELQPLPPSDSTCQEGRSLGATHEQSSMPAFTAVTYGRLTGKPGVCMSTLGPGLLHFCFTSKVLS